MKTNILILAGGMGTRMKSLIPKVMHRICGKPILEFIVNTSMKLNPSRIILLVGNGSDKIENHFSAHAFKQIKFAHQDKQLGTGDALKCAVKEIETGSAVVILSGDVPLISEATIGMLIEKHRESRNSVTVLTMLLDNPEGYGRIIRDGKFVKAIIEHRDATSEQRKINEVNTGIYCMNADFIFEYIEKIDNNNVQKEYYITDLIKIAHDNGKGVDSVIIGNHQEVLGINNRVQLSEMEQIIVKRKIEKLMFEGVSFNNPQSIYIEPDVEIGGDSHIESNVVIKGKTKIGRECNIGAFSYIENAILEDKSIIKPYSRIDK